MHRKLLRWTACCCLLLCNLQCGTCPPPPPGSPTESAPQTVQPVLQWDERSVPSPFWIARSEQVCRRIDTQHGSWIPRPLLQIDATRFCLYLWHGDPKAPDEAALRDAPGLHAEPDYPVLVAAAHDAERDAKWFHPWHEVVRTRLAIPTSRPEHPADAHVRVAVLDTASDTASGRVLDRLGHGRAVDRLIEELACDQLKRCATEVVNYPSLPLLSDELRALGIDELGAGAVGTRGILAARIEQATADWLAERDQPGGAQQLVINLSVGWSGCWDKPGELASDVVRSAITRATCQGALVVAASGNGDIVPGCPTLAPGKPAHMLPGLWGGTPTTDADCKRLGASNARTTPSAPLLIGVGAVDHQDRQPLSIDHEANLVAYGQNIVVGDTTSDNGWTVMLSGTSMGAAALSGMAAALWSYRPQLPRARILELLRDSAVPLRAAPSGEFVCNELGGCKQVQRLALCPALEQLALPALPACNAPKPNEASAIELQTMLTAALPQPVLDCSACPDASCTTKCQLPPGAADGDAQDAPWVVPQPKPPACGTCVLHAETRRIQVQLLKPVNGLRLTVRTSPNVNRTYYLGNVGTSALEWLLPPAVQGATGAVLGYQPVGGGSSAWERGDIPITGQVPFESSGPLDL